MSDLYYPTPDEVNELLEAADELGFTIDDPAYYRLCLTARGCKAEADAYRVLSGIVQVEEESLD